MPREIRIRTADGILDEVAIGGRIRIETLQEMMRLLEQKTDFHFHIALEVYTKTMLKTVDNEAAALETIKRLRGAPDKKMTSEAKSA